MAFPKIPDMPETTSKFDTFFESANRLRTVPGLRNPFIPNDVWEKYKVSTPSDAAADDQEKSNGYQPANGHHKANE